MSERRVPTPHHVFDEATELESFSVSRTSGLILAEVIYVEEVTPIPSEGQVVEFRVLGTSVQGIVNHTSLMDVRGEVYIHIQARRIQE
jgi:hypothetical protein